MLVSLLLNLSMGFKKHIYFGIALFLALTILIIKDYPDNNFRIIACDVDQGDAFLITHKNNQVLIDGGKGSAVLDCLGRYMPFWDRDIELVVLTHPQLDHYGGLIEVFKSYDVDNVLISSLESGNQEYQVLENLIVSSQARIIRPDVGKKIGVGLIHLDIVHPSQKFVSENSVKNKNMGLEDAVNMGGDYLGSRETSRDPNDFSIVLEISFGEFDAVFTGDIGPEVSEEIIASVVLESAEYIKVPHHGSRNGLSKSLLEKLNPEIAVISVGKNSFGHPHKEVLDMLVNTGVRVFRTDLDGDVVVVSDGERYWVER